MHTYRILANDGIDAAGQKLLTDAGFDVVVKKISQAELAKVLADFDAILVRSATTINREIIDACPSLKLIGRTGISMENIDTEYARYKGIKVINTVEASAQSVAEMVFAHLFGMARFLHQTNRKMPVEGTTNFESLKQQYSKGVELRGKNIGIIGLGKIGQRVARMALGMGMNVLPYDLNATKEMRIELDLFKGYSEASITIRLKTVSFEELLEQSDFLSLHIPHEKGTLATITAKELAMMKDGAGIINTSSAGVIDEKDLLDALNSGKIAFAGFDTFDNEPHPMAALLEHPNVSMTPHIGGATKEAQERIGIEMAESIKSAFIG